VKRLRALSVVMLMVVGGVDRDTAGIPPPSVVEQFLTRSSPAPVQLRSARHLEASTRHGAMRGWVDACTELDRDEFRYEVVAEGGSPVITRRVLIPALEAERHAHQKGEADRAALDRRNYEFSDAGEESGGLVRVRVRPLRKDRMLVDGAIVLTSDDGDLVRVEGLLARRPSFWTRRVSVVRRYARIGGVRLPVSMESTAEVLIVGTSSFSMTYDYEPPSSLCVRSW
jgi:hypothetical protein